MDVKLGLGVLSADILSAVRDIATRVRQSGGRALMVGGSVRDLLLGATDVKDVDLEVFGIQPDALQALIGEKYPLCAAPSRRPAPL